MKQQIAAAALAASLGSSYATAQEMRRVVTGLDERNHSVVLFDSKMPLKQVVPGIIATNFWITDTYPPSLLKDDPSGRPIGTAPPDNGTKFRVVEFLPLNAATEAKMPPEMLQKGITQCAGARHSGEASADASHPQSRLRDHSLRRDRHDAR